METVAEADPRVLRVRSDRHEEGAMVAGDEAERRPQSRAETYREDAAPFPLDVEVRLISDLVLIEREHVVEIG